MIRVYWQRACAEWRASRRLRLAALVALVVLAFHAISLLEDSRQSLARQYVSDLELQSRLEGMRGQRDWEARASQAEAMLAEMRDRVPQVSGGGLAQAELQSWLSELSTRTALADPRVRVEQPMDVPGYPDMWQVMARLDAQIPQHGNAAVLRALSEGLPWIQVERLEIGEGVPARLQLVVRGYYRRALDTGDSPQAAGGEGVAP